MLFLCVMLLLLFFAATGIYSLFSFVVYFTEYHRAFSVFLLLYGIGFSTIGWLSRPRRPRAASRPSVEVRPLLGAKVASAKSASGT